MHPYNNHNAPLLVQVVSQQPMSPELVTEFEAFITECLEYLGHVMRYHGSDMNNQKFWKYLLAKVYEILERVSSFK